MLRTISTFAVPRDVMRLPREHLALLLGGYIAVYVALDAASYVYPVVPLGITPWNPPPGLSLFLLLWCGTRFWPALFCATLAADILVRDIPATLWVSLVSSAIITGAYWAAATILKRRIGKQAPLESTRDLTTFLLVVVAATLCVGIAYVGLYALVGRVSLDDVAILILKYWVGDLNGILVVTPALLCLLDRSHIGFTLRRATMIELALQAGAVLAGLWLVFYFAGDYPYRSFYVLFLPLVWIAARWGLTGASLAQVAIQLGLIVCVQLADYRSATFVQLQMLMTGLCMTGLTIGGLASHRTRLELALQQKQADLGRTQQLASAEELTSALAHQLNQPMTALSSYLGSCRLLLSRPSLDIDSLRSLMDKAAAEAHRAGDVVSRLRDFYQRGISRAQTIRISDLVEHVVHIARRQANAQDIQITLEHDDPSLLLNVDPVQIENALQNVVHNAMDALSERPGRTPMLSIRTSATFDSVRITIRDNGPGVAQDIVTHLFEPFTTSKSHGMGMGLAIARTLAGANGGSLELEHSSDAGTAFTFILPRTRGVT
ncbi:MAG TPA: ATP-binding protein [Vicinamibacterales bacterium]|nr:ATP-binding protein [Vicinamibacterales bacterium]